MHELNEGLFFFSKNFGTKVVVAQSSNISWSTLELGKVWRKAPKFPLRWCYNELRARHTPCSVVYMTIIAAWRFTECDALFELLHHMCNPVRRRGNDVAIYNKRLRNKYVILSWQSPWPWCRAPWAKHRSLSEWYILLAEPSVCTVFLATLMTSLVIASPLMFLYHEQIVYNDIHCSVKLTDVHWQVLY